MEVKTPSAESAATPTQPPAEHLAGDSKYCAEVLLDLVDIGRELARMVLHEVQSQAAAAVAAGDTTATPAQDGIIAFERVARAVRRTVLLHDKVTDPNKKPLAAHRVAARRKIIRDVEDAIHSAAPEDEQETLHAELMERLDRPELDDEIAQRSIGDIVTDINHDLGIAGLYGSHPWKRRIPHDVALLNARAEQFSGAAPSEKLIALLASAPPRPPTPKSPGRIAATADAAPPDGPPLDAADVAKMSDEEIEARLERLRRWT
jgi:hypothetical protein